MGCGWDGGADGPLGSQHGNDHRGCSLEAISSGSLGQSHLGAREGAKGACKGDHCAQLGAVEYEVVASEGTWPPRVVIRRRAEVGCRLGRMGCQMADSMMAIFSGNHTALVWHCVSDGTVSDARGPGLR